MKALFKGINLSGTQKNQVKAIREKYKGQEQALREQMKPLREQFAAARKANDTAKLEQLREQVRPQMERARALRQQQMQEVRGVLNAEQQKQLDANIANAREHFGQRGGRGQGRGVGRDS